MLLLPLRCGTKKTLPKLKLPPLSLFEDTILHFTEILHNELNPLGVHHATVG